VRFHSTKESAERGEVTVLACLETVAAVAISFLIARHRHSIAHIKVAACLAPLLLLRTPHSTGLALHWIDNFYAWAQRRFAKLDGLGEKSFTLSLLILWPLFLFLARSFSIAATVVRHPLDSLQAIPSNWRWVTLETDLFHPPEVVPGAERHLQASNLKYAPLLTFESYLTEFRRYPASDSGARFADVLLGALTYLPAMLYRFSLKSTCAIYLPLLFIADDHKAPDLKGQLNDLVHSEIEGLKRWYSLFVLVCLNAIPITIYFAMRAWWHLVAAWMESHISVTAIRLSSVFLFTTPQGIELDGWHIARTFNCLLTLVLFLFAREKLRKNDEGPPSEAINAWLRVRRVLTVYIIGCTVYLIVTTVDWHALPPVHVRWLPA